MVPRQVTEQVEQQYTVMVPYTETRKATRQVAKPVTETLTREYTVIGD